MREHSAILAINICLSRSRNFSARCLPDGPRLSSRATADARKRGEALAAHIGQGNRFQAPFIQGLLAEIEAEGASAGAMTRIDEASALADETGQRWSDAFLHRLRVEILLKRDPADKAPAGEAFLAAIAIAQHQKARSLELGAALVLARLCHFTSRSRMLTPCSRLFASPGISRDRRGANASHRADVMSRSRGTTAQDRVNICWLGAD